MKESLADTISETLKRAQSDWMGLARKATAMEKEHRYTQDKLKAEGKQAKDRLKALEDQYVSKLATVRKRLEERKRTSVKSISQGVESLDTTLKAEETGLNASPALAVLESPTKPVITESGNDVQISPQPLPSTAQEEAKMVESQASVLPRPFTFAESPVQKTAPLDASPIPNSDEPSQSPVSSSPSTDKATPSAPLIRTLSYKQPSIKSKFSLPARVSSANELDIESFLGSAANSLLNRSKK